MKRACHIRPHIVWFYLCKMYIKRQNRQKVDQWLPKAGRDGGLRANGWRVRNFGGGDENVLNVIVVMVAYTENILKTTELYNLNGWTVCTSQKNFFFPKGT